MIHNVMSVYPWTSRTNHLPGNNRGSGVSAIGPAYQLLINANANVTFNIRNKIMNEIQIQ